MSTCFTVELVRNELSKMVTFQDFFNSQIDKEWRQAKLPFYIATKVELVEAIDHIGYKWWKKQVPSVDQAFVEIIDAFHFVLSQCMTVYQTGTVEEVVTEIINHLYWHWESDEGELNCIVREEINTTDIVLALDHAIDNLNPQKPFNDIEVLFDLAGQMGYSFLEFAEAYIQKGVLNIFRQQHGYREGTYVKVWNGEEDNIHLRRIAEEHPDNATDIVFLKSALEEIYEGV